MNDEKTEQNDSRPLALLTRDEVQEYTHEIREKLLGHVDYTIEIGSLIRKLESANHVLGIKDGIEIMKDI